MRTNQYIRKLAYIVFMGFLTMCLVYAHLLMMSPIPNGVSSILAIGGGALIGMFSVRLFILWSGVDSGGDFGA